MEAALTAHLNTLAHWEDDLDAVVYKACRVAAESTRAGIAGVLQYRVEKDAFVLQTGVG